MAAAFFYLFAGVMVASAFLVIASRNPVHSVLWLILSFFSAAGLFVLAGAEFLAFILVIVYVGAVAVLFLFVVMMLDIDFAELRQGILQYLPIGGLVGVIILAELLLVLGGWAKATVPRYRYDQLMRLGWKVFLPISITMVVVVAGFLQITGFAP